MRETIDDDVLIVDYFGRLRLRAVLVMLPTSYLISPMGELVARQAGLVDAGMIERYIENFDGQNKKGRFSKEQ